MQVSGAQSMVAIFIEYVLPVLVTLLVGAVGWLMARTIGKQIIAFYDLRARTLEAKIFSANIGVLDLTDDDEKARYLDAYKELRRLSAQIKALAVCANWLTSRYFAWRCYDLDKASNGIMGLANSLMVKGVARMHHGYQIESGLKLPHEFSKDEVEATRALDR